MTTSNVLAALWIAFWACLIAAVLWAAAHGGTFFIA